MNAHPISVLVVEDSITIRKHIVGILGAASGIQVVGEASDGRTAIDLCQRLRPDVVTMDMMLPVMTGVAATEHIMAYCPTPILIVSASTNRGEVFKTYDALAAGAVDVLEKPLAVDPEDGWETRLVAAVRMVARIRVITHPRARLGRFGRSDAMPSEVRKPVAHPPRRIVAIGASTGGPGALLTILRALPDGFPLPILLVLHIGTPFGLAIAEWLDTQVKLEVRQAKDREPLPTRPCVLMAPADHHLELVGGRLHLSTSPERHSCRPSVDVLFESLARELGPETIGCLLTGMGKDGAEGLLAIKQRGGLTLVQDEATSVVFGMPSEAIRLGAARQVLPIHAFAGMLTHHATVEEGKPR